MLHVLQQCCAVLRLFRCLVESPGRNTEELKSHNMNDALTTPSYGPDGPYLCFAVISP